jgi:hypothetical protein
MAGHGGVPSRDFARENRGLVDGQPWWLDIEGN